MAAGDDALQIAARMQQREDADLLFRATTAVQDEYLTFQQEARARRGTDAYGLSEDTKAWWGEAAKRHGEGLKTDLQRRAFGEQVARLRMSSVSQMGAYEAAERHSSLESSAKAAVASSINMAAASPNDPVLLAEQQTAIQDRVAVLSDLNGWTPEETSAELARYTTQFHKGVIGAQVDTNPRAAKAYYEAHKDEIDGAERAQIEKTLEIGNLKVRTQEIADKVMDQGKSLTESLDFVRQNYEGEEEAAAVTEIKMRFNEREAAKTQMQRDAGEEAWRILNETGDPNSVPARVQNAMDPQAWATVKEHFQRRIETGADVENNYAEFDRQVAMAANDPKAFLAQDFPTVLTNFDEKHRTVMENLRNETSARVGGPPPRTATTTQMIDAKLAAIGMTERKEFAESRGRIKSEVMSALSAATAANDSKDLTQAQEAEIINNTVLDLALKDPTMFRPSTRDFEARTVAQVREDAKSAISAKYDGSSNADKRNRAKAMFGDVFSRALRAFVDKHGGEPNERERDAMVQKLMTYGRIERSRAGIDLLASDDVGFYFEFADLSKEDLSAFVPEE